MQSRVLEQTLQGVDLTGSPSVEWVGDPDYCYGWLAATSSIHDQPGPSQCPLVNQIAFRIGSKHLSANIYISQAMVDDEQDDFMNTMNDEHVEY